MVVIALFERETAENRSAPSCQRLKSLMWKEAICRKRLVWRSMRLSCDCLRLDFNQFHCHSYSNPASIIPWNNFVVSCVIRYAIGEMCYCVDFSLASSAGGTADEEVHQNHPVLFRIWEQAAPSQQLFVIDSKRLWNGKEKGKKIVIPLDVLWVGSTVDVSTTCVRSIRRPVRFEPENRSLATCPMAPKPVLEPLELHSPSFHFFSCSLLANKHFSLNMLESGDFAVMLEASFVAEKMQCLMSTVVLEMCSAK